MKWPARRSRSVVVCACVVWCSSACAPALNWREVRSEGGLVVALLPCKPDRLSRSLEMGGVRVPVEVLACSAEGSTWALTSADVGDAARVEPALIQLRQARSANLGGREVSVAPAGVPGMTPSPGAVRLRVIGVRPDGQAVAEDSVLFAAGTRVVHAAVLGGAPDGDALSSFFSALKIER